MRTMKVRKVMYPVALMAAAVALFVISVPVHASKTDDRIESSAMESYVFKTYLKGDDIKIKSNDGVVALTGTVSEASHESLARETVASLPGVKSVDSKLQVKGEIPDAPLTDAWISAKVKTTLLFHRSVSAMTEVNTKDGIVTLKGDADNQAQKDLTTEYAKDVDGVKDVKNEMTVLTAAAKPGKKTMGESIDDASITAMIKTTLLFHRSTSALNTKVETNDGAVTLSGKAKNASEKDLATKIVSDVKGVKNVKNQMTIESSE